MAHNSGGKYSNPAPARANDLEIFDRLPPALREVIRNAPYKYSSHTVSPRWTAAMLRAFIAHSVGNSCKLTYGPDHPQAAKQ